jgi:hypothetical protein
MSTNGFNLLGYGKAQYSRWPVFMSYSFELASSSMYEGRKYIFLV